MGRFFEAMQRAAGASSEPQGEDERPPRMQQPNLDDALLSPDEYEGDIFGVSSREEDGAKSAIDTPSAVIRTLESEVSGARTTSRPGPSSEGWVADSALAKPRQPEPHIRAVGTQQSTAPSLKTQPIQTLRRPDPTGVRVHPAYDRIVQRLLAYRKTPRQSVVLVSSAVAGEGSSTVARNVATALSHSGTENVLLVDANLRTPIQHNEFNVPREKGFSDVLEGEVGLTSVIRNDVGLGISLMTCGSAVKSPTRAMTVAAVQGVMMALLSLYDWIIVDSPPVTVYPDAATIGTACGAAIFVVRAESTRSEVAEEAKGILEATGADLLGAVLNRRRYHIPSAIYKRL